MLNLARSLDTRRFAPQLVVLGRTATLAGAVAQHVPVTYANANRIRSALPWLIGHLRALRPSIVISTLAYTNIALLAASPLLPRGTRLVVREANTPDATLKALPRIPGKALYRWLYPRASRVIAQSATIAAQLGEIAPIVTGNISIIPNPVDVTALRQIAHHPRRRPGRGLRLIGAGRLTHQKGFDRLISIAARLPTDSEMTIFGDGPDRTALAAQIEKLGLGARVDLAGFVSDLPAHLAGADALVMPSRWEGLPNVALEALAVGTPVLASPEAALQDIAAAAPYAVRIAASEDEFVDKLCEWPEVVPAGPRASLLPPEYEAASVVRQLETVFTEILNEH
ncbi:glycosyltransferase [Tardiphaga alba]|nr:glycosyltransferase [Tardiphaga alba]